jgi:hypothetical protein
MNQEGSSQVVRRSLTEKTRVQTPLGLPRK